MRHPFLPDHVGPHHSAPVGDTWPTPSSNIPVMLGSAVLRKLLSIMSCLVLDLGTYSNPSPSEISGSTSAWYSRVIIPPSIRSSWPLDFLYYTKPTMMTGHREKVYANNDRNNKGWAKSTSQHNGGSVKKQQLSVSFTMFTNIYLGVGSTSFIT